MGNDPELGKLRRALHRLDAKLLQLLRQRLELASRVALTKKEALIALRDEVREREILTRVETLAQELGLDPTSCREIFREVLAMSIRAQEAVLLGPNPSPPANAHRCCFQGSPWAYSHLAARKFFGTRSLHMEFVGLPTFAACVATVEAKEAGWAVLPIENTTAGSINETYDLLRHTALRIVGEEILQVDHCLLALPGATVTGLRRIISHPQALAQCRAFLSTLGHARLEAFVDTAEAAREVAQRGDPTVAALASAEAGQAYGLVVLASSVADQAENWTRFVVVSGQERVPEPGIPAKTSLIFTVPHREGALAHCLTILANRGCNLTKLESRPVPSRPWEYMFYVDFMGSVGEARVVEALAELQRFCPSLKVLGSYPARVPHTSSLA